MGAVGAAAGWHVGAVGAAIVWTVQAVNAAAEVWFARAVGAAAVWPVGAVNAKNFGLQKQQELKMSYKGKQWLLRQSRLQEW